MGLIRLQLSSLILCKSAEAAVNKPRISGQFSWWFEGKAVLGRGAPSHWPKVPLGFSWVTACHDRLWAGSSNSPISKAQKPQEKCPISQFFMRPDDTKHGSLCTTPWVCGQTTQFTPGAAQYEAGVLLSIPKPLPKSSRWNREVTKNRGDGWKARKYRMWLTQLSSISEKAKEGKEQHSGSAQPVPEERRGRCQQTLQDVLPIEGLGSAGRTELLFWGIGLTWVGEHLPNKF